MRLLLLLNSISLICSAPDLTDLYCRVSKRCHLVVFGNSLSDDGINPATGDLYGFHRVSNGPVWPDYLARMLGLRTSNVNNYAFSGAMSGLNNYNFPQGNWSGQLWQVQQYLNDVRHRIQPTTLFAIESAGNNDLFWASEQDLWEQTELEVVRNVMLALEMLIDNGARRVLLLELFDDSYAPFLQNEATEQLRVKYKHSVDTINQNLAKRFASLEAIYPSVRLVLMQFPERFFEEQVAGLIRHVGLSTTHKKNDTFFKENLQYAWYDGYHPNTQMHEIIARNAYEAWMK